MPRTFTNAERTQIAASHVNHYVRVEIKDSEGVWKDLSNLGGTDWLDGVTWGETADRPVAIGTLELRRDTDGDSIAPTIGASSINRDSHGAYVALLQKGASLRISTAVTANGVTPTTEWKEMLLARVDKINWHQNPITVDFSDIGAWIQDATLMDEAFFANDPETPTESMILLKQVIQNILAAPAAVFGGTPAVYEPAVIPWAPIDRDKTKRRSKFEIARDFALQVGADLRYRYDSNGVFRLTLFYPDRENTTPDWTLGPTEYRDVRNLETAIADIRNLVRVRYIDEDGNNQYVESSDAASQAKYGVRFMEVAEDASSNINTAGEALDLAHAAVSDLAESPTDQEIDTLYFWPVQLGDVGKFLANGDHYDSDQILAVASYTHTFRNGEGSTTMGVRGRVIGAYRTWLRKALDPTKDDTRQNVSPELLSFHKAKRSDTAIRFAWENSSSVDQVWIYKKTLSQNSDEDPKDFTTAATSLEKHDSETTTFDVDYPPSGQITYLLFVPYDADLLRGVQQFAEVLPVVDGPSVFGLTQQVGASGLFTDVTNLYINDPQALGGRLRAWINHDSEDSANLAGPYDAYIDLASTPTSVDETTTFHLVVGGTSQILDNIRVHPGRGKRIGFEFINSLGSSSGVQSFTLLSEGGIIDKDGQLLDDSINRAEAFATNVLQPVRVLASLDDAAPDGSFGSVVEGGALILYKREDGVWKRVANTDDLAGQINAEQIEDAAVNAQKLADAAVLSTKIALGAVDANAIGAAAVTTVKIALGAVDTNAIAATAVTTAKIAAAAVDASLLATNAVTAPAIAASAVTTAKISAGAVTTTELAALAVQAGNIAAGAITTSKINAGAVTSTEIAALAITAGNIAAGAIVTAKLAAGAITTNELAAGAVTAVNITAGTITGNEIAASTITGGKISGSTITGTHIIAGSIDTAHIVAGAITASQIAANSITTAALQAGAVNASAIAAGAVTAIKISVTTLSEISTGAGTIVSGKLQNLAGTNYLDLSATGSNPFLQHTALSLNADGSANFSGTVSATNFTGSGAQFTNGLTIGSYLFVSPSYGVVFSTSTASGTPRIWSDGTHLYITGSTTGSNQVDGRVFINRSGTFLTQYWNIPAVVVKSGAPVLADNALYKQGDLWADISTGFLYAHDGVVWFTTKGG